MHVKVLAGETLRAVTANVTLKLQSLFKKGRMKEKMSRGRGRRRKRKVVFVRCFSEKESVL
jgi:hypothetical protein